MGAINAAIIALTKPTFEQQSVELLLSFWLTLTPDNILKQWKFGIAEGVINKKGLYDNSPFKDLMSEVFKDFQGLAESLRFF